jgi:hypothetical protein
LFPGEGNKIAFSELCCKIIQTQSSHHLLAIEGLWDLSVHSRLDRGDINLTYCINITEEWTNRLIKRWKPRSRSILGHMVAVLSSGRGSGTLQCPGGIRMRVSGSFSLILLPQKPFKFPGPVLTKQPSDYSLALYVGLIAGRRIHWP